MAAEETEELEASLATYEAQLGQVRDASSSGGRTEDLVQLEEDLSQLIRLTRENLLELKKKRLLAELAEMEAGVASSGPEGPASRVDDADLDGGSTLRSDDTLVAAAEGQKCRAPFRSAATGSVSYHNAVVFETCSPDPERVSLVKVVYSNPTERAMLPCRFYLEGRCRFQEGHRPDRAGSATCKFSHGEAVAASDLKGYREPDFSRVAEGSRLLARDPVTHLWHHATVEGLERVQEQQQQVHLRFDRNNKDVATLPLDHVLPLSGSSSSGSEGDEDEEPGDGLEVDDGGEDPAVFVPVSFISAGSGSRLGEWEAHTRGAGSRLMALMGYVHGTGLGKDAEGRVEPVPVTLYPAGVSLDWCMENRSQSRTVEEKSLIQAKRELRRQERAKAREDRAESLFKFINTALSSSGCPPSGPAAGGNPRKPADSEAGTSSQKLPGSGSGKGLRVESFKAGEEIRRAEREIQKLNESLSRHKDPRDRAMLAGRLAAKKGQLQALRSRELNLGQRQSEQASLRKLQIF